MVSREPLPGTAPSVEGSQEKAMAVRSVLLNRDSPDVESRLKRRRNRTQQVRFKDLVEGGTEPAAAPGPHTPRASPPPRLAPAPAALRASRRSWPQAQPGSLTLPMPRKACMSTAIQTSPSLQKPFPAPQPRSSSACDVAGDAATPAVVASARCLGDAVPTGIGYAVPPRAPGSLPVRDHATAIVPHAAVCRVPPPPPSRDPCPPYPGTAACPAARCASPARSCTPEPCPPPAACARLRGNTGSGRGAAPRPASVPCSQSWLPTEPPVSRSDSEWSLPRGHTQPSPSISATDPPSPRRPAQGTPPRDPPAPQHQPWGGPCCASPAPIPPAPRWHGSAATVPDKPPAALGHLDPHGIGTQRRSAEPGHGRAAPASQGAQTAAQAPELPRHRQPCLSAEHSDTLHHVQDLLQLVVVAKGPSGPPSGDQDARTSQGARPRERGDLRSQLQSLEGVLETSQQTIRVLLDVIQDLEKKEAQRDGRHSYRTGQDIANCGTCRDCACIIYSVEHDFRQQEGRFQRVLSHIAGDTTLGSPAAVAEAALPPRQELSPVTKLPTKLDTKKSRRKCFWFL
ncbi:INSYN2B protein-like isoform X2 [Cuculus canorus]|uniref:INSYN2B protein-like isoform X2 n=1 Tax=Cuculus canorus TaxID=55661 RepID=UPI0023AADABE|nr:INSYN2B protein-like isoform X2 [Cuculus canorus]